MRSPPPPALQNVLVARPGTTSSAVVRRDDLLAAAALAADEREPRRRSVLALVHRRWARFSESLRRRRNSTPASQAAAALASTEAPFYAIERNDVVAAFDRERARQTVDPESNESREMREEASVSSSRDYTNSRRVRQVGAKEDDDTLLMLPRVASVSFSSPDREVRTHGSTPRVRQLPRVSALMPTRAPRPHVVASPVSSDGRASASASDEGGRDSDGSYSDEYEGRESNELSEEDEEQEDDVEESVARRPGFHRLPTGLTNMDVERAMEKAVVEIASDGESDSGAALNTPLTKKEQQKMESGEGRAGEIRILTSTRSRSEAHENRPRQNADENQVITAFSRRISSSTHTYSKRSMLSEDDTRPFGSEDHKLRFHKSQDYALFEDDYLSFQGFIGHSESRSHQGMGSLLRSRRISSITDSHSENSDDNTAVRSVASSDTRRKQPKTNSILSSVFFHKRSASPVIRTE